MTNIMSDDNSEGITNSPANMHRLKLQQKELPKGGVQPFWSRQEISKTKDIQAGYEANMSYGWYSFANDRKAQRSAQKQLDSQGIVHKDWATGADVKVKKTQQPPLDFSLSQIALRRREKTNGAEAEKGFKMNGAVNGIDKDIPAMIVGAKTNDIGKNKANGIVNGLNGWRQA